MSEEILSDIVNHCATKTLTVHELQLRLMQIANYLKNGVVISEGSHKKLKQEETQNEETKYFKEEEINREQKSTENVPLKLEVDMKQEVARMEQFMERKLKHVNQKFNEVEEMVLKVNEKQQQNNSIRFTQIENMIYKVNEIQQKANIESNKNLEKYYKTMFQNSMNFTQDQIKQLKIDIKLLREELNNIKVQMVDFRKKGSWSCGSIKISQKQERQERQERQESQEKRLSKYEYKQQKWYNRFNFDGRMLTKMSYGSQAFIFFEELPFGRQFRFDIRIVRSPNRDIGIGIIDYQKYQSNLFSTHDFTNYCAWNGKKYPGRVEEGNGVAQGQTVEVRVDRSRKTIKWVVNGVQRASLVVEMLGDKERQLFPFVSMSEKEDKIQFMMK